MKKSRFRIFNIGRHNEDLVRSNLRFLRSGKTLLDLQEMKIILDNVFIGMWMLLLLLQGCSCLWVMPR